MNPQLLLAIPLAPLIAAAIAGLAGRYIGRIGAHTLTIAGVALAFGLSVYMQWLIYSGHAPAYDGPVYTWLVSGGVRMQVGFLVDRLTTLMMCVVTFVSLCVHVYTIGYMRDDPGYTRFFSYIALFTFGMLMLVMANNFMQLFFGWEAVGVVSYLLIGFWYKRPSAIFANLKAFIVNRVGDFGFVIGIAALFSFTHSLSYKAAFAAAPHLAHLTLPVFGGVSALTLICVCLFIGAMGKSAQVPLHVWLPDSMEGPTPISALIHAATMVTAGVYMVARMSPLFEYSSAALSFVMVIGATNALFMGILGVVNNDIKRVVAYSTLSQLGYMVAALGVSDYAGGIFHLMTHACFKALLFLAAGSVIMAMHHEQDMRKMGGLGKYMPITAITCWIGGLSLVAFPFFSGYYSKDAIIEAVGLSQRWGSTYAYWCLLLGAFVTALYTFRLLFMTFHGEERFRRVHAAHDAHGGHDEHAGHGGGIEPRENSLVVTLPLIALAIPSVLLGYFTVGKVLYGNYFGKAIFVLPQHNVLALMARDYHGPFALGLHGFLTVPFALVLAGLFTAWLFVLKRPEWADAAAVKFAWLKRILDQKYYFDWFNERVLARLARGVGLGLWKVGDQGLIDGALVNGTANSVGGIGGVLRRVQSGYLYSYAFWMMIGLAALLGWFLLHA